ncbi:hypothetical protein L1606_26205 [Streptomyces spororaveus]|uniref:hypothetical protein n=1 Tax=Streptomyces spororaveus TaxID=284039 RepID=UPI00207A0A36|nr:hypothetical protein [Streptomyces spororaveus]MCM9081527.1 hypothetical protein [Streptomyces spororaveus]
MVNSPSPSGDREGDSRDRGSHRFGFGFSQQPAVVVVGPGAFGHSGAAGAPGFADPVTGIAYGCTRRRVEPAPVREPAQA